MDSVASGWKYAARLKQTKRAGWLRAGVEAGQCESVADHSFGVALLALVLPPAAGLDVDRDRCVRLALVHDLAEAIVGDMTPHDPISKEEKHRLERAAMERLAAEVGGAAGAELLALWEEFEAGGTPEAKLVRELDVIEMAWQARAYARDGLMRRDRAEPFVMSAAARVGSVVGTALLAPEAAKAGEASGKP